MLTRPLLAQPLILRFKHVASGSGRRGLCEAECFALWTLLLSTPYAPSEARSTNASIAALTPSSSSPTPSSSRGAGDHGRQRRLHRLEQDTLWHPRRLVDGCQDVRLPPAGEPPRRRKCLGPAEDRPGGRLKLPSNLTSGSCQRARPSLPPTGR